MCCECWFVPATSSWFSSLTEALYADERFVTADDGVPGFYYTVRRPDGSPVGELYGGLVRHLIGGRVTVKADPSRAGYLMDVPTESVADKTHTTEVVAVGLLVTIVLVAFSAPYLNRSRNRVPV
jgi:hypothetical protein